MSELEDVNSKLSLVAEMRPSGELMKDYKKPQDDNEEDDDNYSRSDDEVREIEDYYNNQDRSMDEGENKDDGDNGVDSNVSTSQAGRSSAATMHTPFGGEMVDDAGNKIDIGTILEAAFVDPAYTWPPPEGEGRNAIELQASISLMNDLEDNEKKMDDDDDAGTNPSYQSKDEDSLLDDDEDSAMTGPSVKLDMPKPPPPYQPVTHIKTTTTTTTTTKRGFWCCARTAVDDVIVTDTRKVDDDGASAAAAQAMAEYEAEAERMRAQHAKAKEAKDKKKQEKLERQQKRREEKEKRQQEREQEKERKRTPTIAMPRKLTKEERKQMRYGSVPEGILIYRLNTTTHMLTLLSQPHNKTDLDRLIRHMKISKAVPSHDRSRRGMILTDAKTGKNHTLVACEQRTAIAWLETMTIMLDQGNPGASQTAASTGVPPSNSLSDVAENRHNETNDQIQEQYLNIANYSNKLIRSGALPNTKKGGGGAGGIYYSIDIEHKKGKTFNQEALESIAKRRAVIKDSWDFYRMICSLLRDKNKYDEVFRKMQLDPVYPYLNSMSGLNDPADGGITDKVIYQKDIPEYRNLSNQQIAEDLVTKAEIAMPSLVEICKALAGSLGMEEVGVGPIKDVQSALRKAERKYQGDLLKITDYCRALLVVRDFPALLALLELARDSFGPLIRRVKMSSLKSDHKAKPGGYRDCIINVELKEHICEIQVHLWPMWGVCGVDGFRHYRHCLEYNTDSFENPYESLEGLSRKTRAELIVMAEEAVVDTPIDDLEWYHEKHILDYFAEVGLFLKHGLDIWAEITLRQLIKLRTESPDIGPDHHETIILFKYLAQALNNQGKTNEAEQAMLRVRKAKTENESEREEADKSLWESFLAAQTEAFDMIMDPNKKERDEEENLKREVKASKKQWRRIRNERFKFLDLNIDAPPTPQSQVKVNHGNVSSSRLGAEKI